MFNGISVNIFYQDQKEEYKDYRQLTAPCGLPCFACYLYLANGDEEMRHLVSKELGLPPDQASCPGCRALGGKPAHLPVTCRVFPCAQLKQVQFCSDCADFPCDFLHLYFDRAKMWHNTKIFNLCLIKKLGLKVWAEEKAGKVLEEYSFGKFGCKDQHIFRI